MKTVSSNLEPVPSFLWDRYGIGMGSVWDGIGFLLDIRPIPDPIPLGEIGISLLTEWYRDRFYIFRVEKGRDQRKENN